MRNSRDEREIARVDAPWCATFADGGMFAELRGCGASAAASLHGRRTLARRARFCVEDRAVGSQIVRQFRARRIHVLCTSGRRSRVKS